MNLDAISPRIGETRRLSIVAETVAEAAELEALRHSLDVLGLSVVAQAAGRAMTGEDP